MQDCGCAKFAGSASPSWHRDRHRDAIRARSGKSNPRRQQLHDVHRNRRVESLTLRDSSRARQRRDIVVAAPVSPHHRAGGSGQRGGDGRSRKCRSGIFFVRTGCRRHRSSTHCAVLLRWVPLTKHCCEVRVLLSIVDAAREHRHRLRLAISSKPD